MTRNILIATYSILFFGSLACTGQEEATQNAKTISTETTQNESATVASVDLQYTLVGENSFLDGYEPMNADSTVNVVVEIPTGTTAKWEVTKPDGVLKWEMRDGKPRVVKYLGYPGNYGMIPKTLLPKELGGDGDPLDVILLGDALPRGTVTKGRLIGVLRLLDGGEQDDKLLAVADDSPLSAAKSLAELQDLFPGVTEIVELWFANYKGKGEMQANGFGDADEAEAILQNAIAAFQNDPHPDPEKLNQKSK